MLVLNRAQASAAPVPQGWQRWASTRAAGRRQGRALCCPPPGRSRQLAHQPRPVRKQLPAQRWQPQQQSQQAGSRLQQQNPQPWRPARPPAPSPATAHLCSRQCRQRLVIPLPAGTAMAPAAAAGAACAVSATRSCALVATPVPSCAPAAAAGQLPMRPCTAAAPARPSTGRSTRSSAGACDAAWVGCEALRLRILFAPTFRCASW